MRFTPALDGGGVVALAWSACRLCRVTMLGAVPFLLFGLQACSSTSQPTSATTVGPRLDTRELRFLNGEVPAPARGVAINAASNSQRLTDTDGRATFDVPLPIGAAYDASAPGLYLTRISNVRSLTEPITLWPVAPAYPAEFFQELVYSEFWPGRRLTRPQPGTTYLRLSAELASDAETRATHEYAAAVATRVTEGRVQYVLSDNPPAGARVFDLSLDPSMVSVGLTGSRIVRNVMFEGAIRYRAIVNARSARIVVHEVGHTFGLGHNYTTVPGIMGGLQLTDYSTGEQVAVKLMFQRLPGTEWPDTDRALAAMLDGASRTVVISCNP